MAKADGGQQRNNQPMTGATKAGGGGGGDGDSNGSSNNGDNGGSDSGVDNGSDSDGPPLLFSEGGGGRVQTCRVRSHDGVR